MTVKKTVLVCDSCAAEIAEGSGAVMRSNPVDGRKPTKTADLCDACHDNLAGKTTARRGRPRKEAAA